MQRQQVQLMLRRQQGQQQLLAWTWQVLWGTAALLSSSSRGSRKLLLMLPIGMICRHSMAQELNLGATQVLWTAIQQGQHNQQSWDTPGTSSRALSCLWPQSRTATHQQHQQQQCLCLFAMVRLVA
jgi:hypothetical protein